MPISIDYKSITTDGPRQKSAGDKWWTRSKTEIPDAVANCITTLQESQTQLDSQRNISVKLYGNSPLYGVHGMTYAKLPSPTIKDRITYNLVQSVVDTVTAKIAKNKPKALILTNKGNYKLQRKAMKLNQFMDGVSFSNNIQQLAPMVFRDACIVGTGVLHIFDWYGQVKYERVLASELLVDELEAMYGQPRQLHRVKNVDRQVLADMFPEHKSAILSANESTDNNTLSRPHISDQLTVAESWHLPSGPEAKDGLHAICIDKKTLLVEEWEKPFFPFAFFHWNKRFYGFWGQSLAEQIQNIQLEINKLLWVIQRSMHLAGTFKVLLENGSKIVKEHLNNDIGALISYTGTPPQYVTPPIVPMEYYQHFQALKQSGYEQAGISMLSAAAQKPAGLDSGRALREYNDIETDRFQIVGQAYQDFYIQINKIAIPTARTINEKYGKLSAQVPGRKFIETIDWKDVDMDEDQYVMQSFPISSLPSDPEGRLATIQEYIQAGMIDQRQGRRLLDFPDLEQVEGLANSVEDRILSCLDKIVDDGIFTSPDPFMDLQLARELSLQYYNQFANQDLEEERLDLLRTFMNQINDLEMKANPPAPPALPAGPTAGPPQPLSPGLSLPPPIEPPTLQ